MVLSLGAGVDRAICLAMLTRIMDNIQYFDVRHEGAKSIVAFGSNDGPPPASRLFSFEVFGLACAFSIVYAGVFPEGLSLPLFQVAIHNTTDTISKDFLKRFDPDVVSMIQQWRTLRLEHDLRVIHSRHELASLNAYFGGIIGSEVRLQV